MPAVDGAATGVGGDGGEQGGVSNAEADFLAFHVAAGLHQARALVDALQQRIAFAFAQYAVVTPTMNRIAMAAHTAHP